ncbi:MAG: hypothetical protein V1735_07835 [Nanoarchaeota archaeon]
MDFIISFFLFSIVAVIFFHFIINKSEESKVVEDELLVEARIISNSFMLQGYPKDWTADTVERIGLTDSMSRFNRTKLLELQKVPYTTAKKLLDVKHDFLIYFEDEQKRAVPVFGVCSYGIPVLNLSKNRSIAFYHGKSPGDEAKTVLWPALQGFNTTPFCKSCGALDDAALNRTIQQYDLLVIEGGNVERDATGSFGSTLEAWVAQGHNALLVGDFADTTLFSMSFNTSAGLNASSVTREPFFLDYPVTSAIMTTGINGQLMSNGTSNDNDTYAVTPDGRIHIASWTFGNGTLAYLASANVTLPTDFMAQLPPTAYQLANHDCTQLNISLVEYNNVIRISRFLVEKNKVISMVILVWE